MAFNVFKKKRQSDEDTYIVALDIGTEFVKTMIAEMADDTLKVIGVGRTRQAASDMHSGAIADITGVVRTCEDALAQAEEQAGLQAKRAVIGIAGELVKGVTNTIKYRRPDAEKPLDEAEMQLIIEKVQERAKSKAQSEIALETGNDRVEVRLINSALVSIHIDGYKVTNPIGFQGSDVAVQIYTAFAPMVHIGALERVAEELSLDLVAVAAEPFAVSRGVLGDDVASTFSAVLIDVGGGTTDIAVVDDGGVEGTKMFGIGGRSFTRTIANECDVTYDEAEELKVTLDDNEQVKKDVHAAIDKTLDVWLDGVELALSEFEAVDHLPRRVLLCGGGASLTSLVDALKKRSWYEELQFAKKPTIQYIKPQDVLGVVSDVEQELDHTYITVMGLLRVGCDTIAYDGAVNELKSKLNRLMKI